MVCFRSNLIKMFTPFGKIVSEDFLWHTQGPKRGVPRGYAFIQFCTNKVIPRPIFAILALATHETKIFNININIDSDQSMSIVMYCRIFNTSCSYCVHVFTVRKS